MFGKKKLQCSKKFHDDLKKYIKNLKNFKKIIKLLENNNEITKLICWRNFEFITLTRAPIHIASIESK